MTPFALPQPEAGHSTETTPQELGLKRDQSAHPLTSGFGSLIEEEHELRIFLRECIQADSGSHRENTTRVFKNHVAEVEEILGLLDRRSNLLPHPSRFAVLKSQVPFKTHAHRVEQPIQPVLLKLVNLHLHLLGIVETLLKKHQNSEHKEALLAEVAQRHDEMVWMLTALHNEDIHAADPDFVPTITFGSLGLAGEATEQNWDDDGGGPRQTS